MFLLQSVQLGQRSFVFIFCAKGIYIGGGSNMRNDNNANTTAYLSNKGRYTTFAFKDIKFFLAISRRNVYNNSTWMA